MHPNHQKNLHLHSGQPPVTLEVHCTAWLNSALTLLQELLGQLGSLHPLACTSRLIVRCSWAALSSLSASVSRTLVSSSRMLLTCTQPHDGASVQCDMHTGHV